MDNWLHPTCDDPDQSECWNLTDLVSITEGGLDGLTSAGWSEMLTVIKIKFHYPEYMLVYNVASQQWRKMGVDNEVWYSWHWLQKG